MKTTTKILLSLIAVLLVLSVAMWKMYSNSNNEITRLKTAQLITVDSMKVEHFETLQDTLQKIIRLGHDTIVRYKFIVKEKKQNLDSLVSKFEANESLETASVALYGSLKYAGDLEKLVDKLDMQLYDCYDLCTLKDSSLFYKNKQLVTTSTALYESNKKIKKLESNKLYLGIHLGTGINTNLVGGDIRLGHSLTVGLTYKFRIR